MRVIEGIENIDEEYPNLCIALGTFDGVHFGHQEVIGSAIRRAKEINGTAMVFTFSPHPLRIITSKKGPKLINSKEEKTYILEKLGVDVLVFAHFTVEFSDLHPKEFIKNILKDTLNAKELFVGFNYSFGKKGIGNTDYLKTLSDEFDLKINVIDPYKINNEIVSSTLIRKNIAEGKLEDVEKLLGYPLMITGKVVKGKRLGTKLGFPTANLKIVHKAYPPYGVYGVQVILAEGKKEYFGVMNIGVNPTLKPGEHSIEVHILDYEGQLYGKEIIIKVLKYIREEKKFDDVDQLVDQINDDIKIWKEWLECH